MNSIMWSHEDYMKAYDFAAKLHSGQTMLNGTSPYLLHLTLVSIEIVTAINMRVVKNEILAIQCAILHDVLEDTEANYEKVLNIFGCDVADGVLSLTKNRDLPKSEQLLDSLKRILDQPYEIWMVKMADRIANLQSPPSFWSKQKNIKYREEAILIYETLRSADAFLSSRLLERISVYEKFCV